MSNSGVIFSQNASYETASDGLGSFSSFDWAGGGVAAGQGVFGGTFTLKQGFFEIDTAQFVTAPDRLYVNVVGGAGCSGKTLRVALTSFSGSPPGSGNWRTSSMLSTLVPLASYTATANSVQDILEIPTAGLTYGGALQFIFWTSDQQNTVQPTTADEFFSISYIFAKTNFVDPGTVGTYAAEVIADSPEMWWRLNESSGTVAADSSGNSNSGTYTNGPTLGQAGLLFTDSDTAIAGTNPSDTYIVSVNDFATADFSSAGMSYECIAELTDVGFFFVVAGFENGPFTDFDAYYTLASSPTTQLMNFFVDSTPCLFMMEENVATHIVSHVPASGNGNASWVMVNGDLWQTVNPQASTLPMTFTGANPFYAGSDGVGDAMTGILDEIALYSAALSITRARKHAKASGLAGVVHQVYSVTKPDYCKDPSYHPDGTSLIFAERLGSAYNISTLTIAGLSHAVVHTGTNPFADPTYSPDGEYVLFAEQTAAPTGSHTFGNWAIKYIDPDNVVHTIVSTTNANMHPVWLTPTQIAFQRFRYGTDTTFHIVLMDLSGVEIADLGEGEYPRLVST